MSVEHPLLIGFSPAITGVRDAIEKVAATDAIVLIQGETGTGKELIARLIHVRSRRSAGPFVAANCGGFVSGLIASDLFGHEVGAFTGAVRRRVGRFEAAHNGTLLLDEVGELPAEHQPHLLRVLETSVVERVGGESIPVDVRILAATNRDLATDVRKNRFRADLFYRLNVFPILVPPLRDRPADIAELAHHFLGQFAARHDRPAAVIPDRTMHSLLQYDWPGNVRELRNIIERAVIASEGEELAVDATWFAQVELPEDPNGRTWAAQEKRRILETLRETGGRIYGPGGAAQRLGLRPTTLYGKMRKHGITKGPATWE